MNNFNSNPIIIQEDVAAQLQESQQKEQVMRNTLSDLRKQVINIMQEYEMQKVISSALTRFQKNVPESEAAVPPSVQARKPFETISPQIRNLVIEKVLIRGEISYEKAAAIYGISRASVGRIIAEEKKFKKTDLEKVIKKKRGRKSSLQPTHLIYLLKKLEDVSTISLKKMVEDLETKYNISTSISALNRQFKQMEIT